MWPPSVLALLVTLVSSSVRNAESRKSVQVRYTESRVANVYLQPHKSALDTKTKTQDGGLSP